MTVEQLQALCREKRTWLFQSFPHGQKPQRINVTQAEYDAFIKCVECQEHLFSEVAMVDNTLQFAGIPVVVDQE